MLAACTIIRVTCMWPLCNTFRVLRPFFPFIFFSTNFFSHRNSTHSFRRQQGTGYLLSLSIVLAYLCVAHAKYFSRSFYCALHSHFGKTFLLAAHSFFSFSFSTFHVQSFAFVTMTLIDSKNYLIFLISNA